METTSELSLSNIQRCVPHCVADDNWTGLLFQPKHHLLSQNSSSPPHQRPATHRSVYVSETLMTRHRATSKQPIFLLLFIKNCMSVCCSVTLVNVLSFKLGTTCERILRMSLSVWLELICPSRSSAVRHWEAKLATLLPS